ncbi:MAG: hypothetical protein AB7Y46_18625 [Armatimonadota bacterium]
MKAKTKLIVSGAALVALSVALMVAFGQAGHRAELLQVAASFLGVDPAQLEAFEVGPVAGERDVYAVKGSLPLEGQPGQSERVRLQVNLPQRLVVEAEWADHGSDVAASGEVAEDRLREVAEAFARAHCPFWTDHFELEGHDGMPVKKRSFYICSWTSPPQAGRGACRVSLCLRAADQQPFVYSCS